MLNTDEQLMCGSLNKLHRAKVNPMQFHICALDRTHVRASQNTSRHRIDSVFPQSDEALKGARRRKKGERTHPRIHTFSVHIQVNYYRMTFLLCRCL